MKNNKRTIVMIIITIAVFLVAIIGATYAYFASSTNADAVINAGVATAKSSAFSSSTSGNIEFNVDFNEMSQAGASNTYIKTDNATLSVDLSSEDERSTTICNYDVVWVWDSTDRYTQSDVVLPYTHNGVEYPYEFSVQVGTDVEKDLSSLDWDYDGTAIISSKTIEVAQKGSKHEDYDVVVRMYNIPVNQANLFNKEFKAHIKVENLNCISVRETKLAYYVINGETETKVETIPKGGYRLNTDRTTCKRGGIVTGYNSITGELTTSIQMGDECDIYFDELPIITATGDSVTSNYDGTSKELNISVSDVTDYEVYYSLDKELTRENYTEGSTTHPEVKEIGTTKVYWCAVAENYAPYCSSNDIVIGEGIISLNVSDYNEAYDGNSHKLVVSDLVPSTATMYYSETTKLTKDNYSTAGKTDEPERTTAGTSIIYWCAVANKYTPQCGENKIIVNNATMVVNGQDYVGAPDGGGHSITVSVTKPASDYNIYYSTTQLTVDNYSTVGSESNPVISNEGTTTVYWCAVADNYNPVCSSNNINIDYEKLSKYIMNEVYNSQANQTNIKNKVAGLYYHNASGAKDKTYRYAGANESVNNYICFQEENMDCNDENNLYRVISVDSTTNKTKVIKATSIGDMAWNIEPNDWNYDYDINIWEGSTLEVYLNGTYLSSLGNKANLIDKTIWNVGGYTWSQQQESNAKQIYDLEMASSPKVERKIGLMYVSDYEFAALPKYWAKVGYDMEGDSNGYYDDFRLSQYDDWMLTSAFAEWTISRHSDMQDYAFDLVQGVCITNDGFVGFEFAVRPSFNLSPDVKIINANTANVGSKSNPMLIA